MSNYTKIYAVDFDGTLCESKWPDIGAPNKRLIEHLRHEKYYHGAKIILWTCRVGQRLDEAVEWCKRFGLYFDAVNENLPENIVEYGNDSRKIYATCYIDDLAMGRELYNLPFHPSHIEDYSEYDKYPLGSHWILKTDELEVLVEVEEIDAFRGFISVRSIDTDMHYFRISQDIQWFKDKLFKENENGEKD